MFVLCLDQGLDFLQWLLYLLFLFEVLQELLELLVDLAAVLFCILFLAECFLRQVLAFVRVVGEVDLELGSAEVESRVIGSTAMSIEQRVLSFGHRALTLGESDGLEEAVVELPTLSAFRRELRDL